MECVPQQQRLSLRWYLILFGFSAAVGLLVLWRYPVIYGGDPIIRLTNWEHLRLAYQLPLFQVLVHLATRITPDPFFLRLVLVLVSALGACGMARLAAAAFGAESGIYAGLLFASSHFLIFLGSAPYQEVLELTLLFWGLALIFGRSPRAVQAAGYLLLAAACLTRYEAWFAALAAALVRLIQCRPRPLAALRLALPFAIGPLAWIILNHGFSPGGTILFDPAFRPARLWRIPYLLGASLNHTTSVVAVLALVGFWIWWRDPERKRHAGVVETLLLAAVFFLLALPLTAHGMEPDYDRYVTNREVHFLLPCWFLMAAAGLRWLRGRMPAVLAVPAASAVLVFLVTFAYEGYATKRILDQSVNEGNLQLDFALAQMLSTRLDPTQTALIFARPLPPEQTQHFLELIRRRQGEAGVRAARQMMASINIWPFDYARIWVHAPRLREQLVRAQQADGWAPGSAALAIVFDDYTPENPAEQALLERVQGVATASERYLPLLPERAGATVYFLSRGSVHALPSPALPLHGWAPVRCRIPAPLRSSFYVGVPTPGSSFSVGGDPLAGGLSPARLPARGRNQRPADSGKRRVKFPHFFAG